MLGDAWRGCKRCSRGGRGYPCYAHTSPSWVDAVPGKGWELCGECLPLSTATAERSVCECWAGGHACLDRGQLQPVGPAAPL